MAFMIRGVSTVMTVNVKVAYATHEAPFSPGGRRVGEEGETVMTFMIWGASTVMTVRQIGRPSERLLALLANAPVRRCLCRRQRWRR